jgi:hypothetical protein
MNASNRKKILIGLAVLIVVLVGGYFSFMRDNNSDDINPADFRENGYISSEYGFSFTKPEGYNIVEATSPSDRRHSIVMSRMQDSIIPVDGEGPTAITIDIFPNPQATSAATWVRANTISNFNISTTPLKETSVSGASAVSYEWDGLYKGRSVAFMHNGSVILISGTYNVVADQIYNDFDKVIQSFKFEE